MANDAFDALVRKAVVGKVQDLEIPLLRFFKQDFK